MKNGLKYWQAIVLVLGIGFSACEKVIEIDLNEADIKLVVEGNVTNGAGPYLIKLTQSGAYFGESSYNKAEGASVTISDDAGNTDVLLEQDAGMYYTQNLQGTPGRSYTLEIDFNDVSYTATAKMPVAVVVDTSLFYYDDGSSSIFVEPGFYVLGSFMDTKELDYYRIQAFVGGDSLVEVRTPWDGNPVEDFQLGAIDGAASQLIVNPFIAFKSQDTVTIMLNSVSKDSYDYFVSLSESKASGGGGFGSIPQNPPSNISNGALGFFDAYTEDQFTVVID